MGQRNHNVLTAHQPPVHPNRNEGRKLSVFINDCSTRQPSSRRTITDRKPRDLQHGFPARPSSFVGSDELSFIEDASFHSREKSILAQARWCIKLGV
jgi:hypothetical protein